MKLEFEGKVSLGDPARCDRHGKDGAVFIGNVDVIDEVYEHTLPDVHCKAYIDDQLIAEGLPGVSRGWGYSEWTPVDSDAFTVGNTDLIESLQALDGQIVKLLITDNEE